VLALNTQLMAINSLIGWLHELNGSPIRIANVDDPLPGARTDFERLRFAGGFPTGCCDFVQHPLEIVNEQRDVHEADIARSKISGFAIRRREILKQFDLMTTGRF